MDEVEAYKTELRRLIASHPFHANENHQEYRSLQSFVTRAVVEDALKHQQIAVEGLLKSGEPLAKIMSRGTTSLFQREEAKDMVRFRKKCGEFHSVALKTVCDFCALRFVERNLSMFWPLRRALWDTFKRAPGGVVAERNAVYVVRRRQCQR